MQAIIVLLSSLAATFLMRYLYSSSSGNDVQYKIGKTKRFVLRYNKVAEAIGIICLALVGVFVILAWLGIGKIDTRGNLIAFICLVLGFTVAGIALVLIYRNIKIEVTEERIKYWNLFGRTKEILWNEIKRVECVNNGKTLKLITDKKSISVDIQMVGIIAFEKCMMTKLDRSIYRCCKKDACYIRCREKIINEV